MTENSEVTAIAAFVAVAIGSSAVTALVMKQRQKQLESIIRTKDEVIEVWKRNFDRATDKLDTQSLLELHSLISNDSKFYKIMFDNS